MSKVDSDNNTDDLQPPVNATVHVHPAPTCGTPPNSPHAPSCAKITTPVLGCFEQTDPDMPFHGACICTHVGQAPD